MTAVDTEPLAWDPLDEKYKVDPHPIWKRLRDEAPLYYNEQHDFYAVSRFADVDAFSRDPKTFCSSHGTVMEMITAEPTAMEIMIFMDPPEHTRYRRLVSKAFTPRRMMVLEEDIRALCVRLLDAQVGKSSFDYVQDFGARLPAYVIAALLGVPARRPRHGPGLHRRVLPPRPRVGDVERRVGRGHVQAHGLRERPSWPSGRSTRATTCSPTSSTARSSDEDGQMRRLTHRPGRELRPPHRQRRHRDGGPAARLGGADPRQQPRAAGRAGGRRQPDSERRRGAPPLRGAVTGAEPLVHRSTVDVHGGTIPATPRS